MTQIKKKILNNIFTKHMIAKISKINDNNT